MKFLEKGVGVIGKLKVVWKAWDVRSLIIGSFTFQFFLIFIAPFRKRTPSRFVRISTWICYLLADWVAAQAVGLISRATQVSDTAEIDLFGLWAQFLLLHLGGPDTITALALEDNELWLRTALHLGTQAYATLGIVVRSVRQSTLWVATVLMFFAGVIKYLERVTSLHHGRLMDTDEHAFQYTCDLATDGHSEHKLSNVTMVKGAFTLFQAYKNLYADLQIDRNARENVRQYFFEITPEEAYKMVEIQLNFMYEAMYTKMVIIHKTPWKVLRHVVLSLQVACLVIWCFWDKRAFHGYDIRVTYALLIGAIVLDVVAFFRIQLSDWNIALMKYETLQARKGLYNKLLNSRHIVKWNESASSEMWSWFQTVFLARWSVSTYAYYGSSTHDACLNFDKVKGIMSEISAHKRSQVDKRLLTSEIWDFIFEVLTQPCDIPYDISNIGPVTTLFNRALPINTLDYTTVFLRWYRATVHVFPQGKTSSTISSTIAHYLMYLITFQPNMMYAAAGKATIISMQKETNVTDANDTIREQEELESSGENMGFIYGIIIIGSNRTKSKVIDAKEQMEDIIECVIREEKWEILDRVWVELLCHAAITCKPSIHAAKLKEGGELLTFVWLLMVHLFMEPKTFS